MTEGDELAAVLDELGWWLDLLAEADRMARAVPPSLSRAIDEAGGPHEMARGFLSLAIVSSGQREYVRATLTRAMRLLRERGAARPDGAARPAALRSVPDGRALG